MVVLGVLRVAMILLVIGIGALPVLIFGAVPLRTAQGAKYSAVIAVEMARLLLRILHIRLHAPDERAVRTHAGLLVANHLSFADIILLFSLAPMRFLSTIGVRRLPVIGQMAVALDTIFVHRGSKASRSEAREALADQLQKQSYPPLALFPEGDIGPGDHVRAFRHGAFEVAIQTQVRCLPCMIIYQPLTPIHYHDPADSMPKAVWRLATFPGGVEATVSPLTVLDPAQYSNAEQMANAAHQIISAEYERHLRLSEPDAAKRAAKRLNK